jgi:hypothetical protein
MNTIHNHLVFIVFAGLIALWPRHSEARGFELYGGLHTSYAYELPPSAQEGLIVGQGSAYNIMLEAGINFYRWGVFLSGGYRQTFLKIEDKPTLEGSAFSAQLQFQNMLEINAGAKVLLLPYRSWFQIYLSGGATFAPQTLQLLVYNRLVETSFVPRFGAFAQIEATVNVHRMYYIGLFAGARYMLGAWDVQQAHRFPTRLNQIAFLAGIRGGFLLGSI